MFYNCTIYSYIKGESCFGMTLAKSSFFSNCSKRVAKFKVEWERNQI